MVGTSQGRPGSGRMRTGQPPGTAMPMGVGMVTEVKVQERVVTQQGMRGVKTGTMGPGRQIYDKSYYMSKLREKIQELSGELQKFNKEIDDISKDHQNYQAYEKRYDMLIRNVRNLEGDLADYNLALDKHRTDAHPEEVNHMYMYLKSQNDQHRSELDQCFLEKKSHEEEVKKMD